MLTSSALVPTLMHCALGLGACVALSPMSHYVDHGARACDAFGLENVICSWNLMNDGLTQ